MSEMQKPGPVNAASSEFASLVGRLGTDRAAASVGMLHMLDKISRISLA
jgi:hypothetical protein